MSRLYELPRSIVDLIFKFDNRFKENYALCIKELDKYVDNKIEIYKDNLKEIQYYYSNSYKIAQLMSYSKGKYSRYQTKMKKLEINTIKLQSILNENKYDFTKDFLNNKQCFIYTNENYINAYLKMLFRLNIV